MAVAEIKDNAANEKPMKIEGKKENFTWKKIIKVRGKRTHWDKIHLV